MVLYFAVVNTDVGSDGNIGLPGTQKANVSHGDKIAKGKTEANIIKDHCTYQGRHGVDGANDSPCSTGGLGQEAAHSIVPQGQKITNSSRPLGSSTPLDDKVTESKEDWMTDEWSESVCSTAFILCSLVVVKCRIAFSNIRSICVSCLVS